MGTGGGTGPGRGVGRSCGLEGLRGARTLLDSGPSLGLFSKPVTSSRPEDARLSLPSMRNLLVPSNADFLRESFRDRAFRC